jgi:putative transposase
MLPQVSDRRLSRVLGISRAAFAGTTVKLAKARTPLVNGELKEHVRRLIRTHPTYGYRRIWAVLRFREGRLVNRKAVQRIIQLERWQVRKRPATPRPRVQERTSQVATSNTRWAMDMTHIACGSDGWGHLVAVIDCADREIVGYEFALRGRAVEAERAIKTACLTRFGTVRPRGKTPTIRSDNGLIFQSRRFRKACRF